MCRYFFTIGPSITKFDGNVENLTKNATVISKMHMCPNWRWRPPPSWLSNNCCHFFTIGLDQSSPNWMGVWRIYFRTQLLCWKCTFNKVRCGGGRHREFRKVVALSLLLDQCPPKLVGMLRLWYGTHCIVKKRKFIKSQDGGCRHLELRKTLAVPLVFDLFSPNLVGCCTFDVECKC